MKNYEPGLTDRLGARAKARRTQLEKAQASDPKNDPGFAKRQEARRAVAIAREARKAERKAAKLADEIRKAKEQADKEIALKAERERQEVEAAEQAAREIALAAERKAERDRRYAARKARKR
jgi:hypothetical protein